MPLEMQCSRGETICTEIVMLVQMNGEYGCRKHSGKVITLEVYLPVPWISDGLHLTEILSAAIGLFFMLCSLDMAQRSHGDFLMLVGQTG